MTTRNHSCMGDFPLHYYYYVSPQHQHESHNYGLNPNQKVQYLFEKQLTPSDVGKLNRLVIPKQHAERHFPLDGESGEKGLLLRFDDELGKTWWFRYSYWSSSQSYVITKGWSRFVKEKRLCAGDTVVFEKKFAEAQNKLCIGWRRRDAIAVPTGTNLVVLQGTPQTHLYDCSANHGARKNGSIENSMGSSYSSAPTNSKKLRLFGVNLECGLEDTNPQEPVAADCDIDPRELQLLPCIGFSDS